MTHNDPATFESAYSGTPPWEIGRPQQAFLAVADRINGAVLDAGCGTGDNALFFAERGQQVTGIDFAAAAISQAKQKASGSQPDGHVPRHGRPAVERSPRRLRQRDRQRHVSRLLRRGPETLRRGNWGRPQAERSAFLAHHQRCRTCPAGEERTARRVSAKEIQESSAAGWRVESIEPTRIEVRPGLKEGMFSEGGPRAWFVVVQRA